jgi:hypothetical protein
MREPVSNHEAGENELEIPERFGWYFLPGCAKYARQGNTETRFPANKNRRESH